MLRGSFTAAAGEAPIIEAMCTSAAVNSQQSAGPSLCVFNTSSAMYDNSSTRVAEAAAAFIHPPDTIKWPIV
jgi:hypothetical protein